MQAFEKGLEDLHFTNEQGRVEQSRVEQSRVEQSRVLSLEERQERKAEENILLQPPVITLMPASEYWEPLSFPVIHPANIC